jgi:hypothetical protein
MKTLEPTRGNQLANRLLTARPSDLPCLIEQLHPEDLVAGWERYRRVRGSVSFPDRKLTAE